MCPVRTVIGTAVLEPAVIIKPRARTTQLRTPVRRGATMADEKPYGRVTQKAPAVSDVHVLWITAGLSLRRRLGVDHRRDAAEHRGRPPGSDSRPAEGAPAQPGARLRGRRRLHEVLVSGRARASSIRSCSSSKARSPTRRSRRKATGRRSAPTRRPASRSPPTSGSTGWRRRRWRSWRAAPAPPTAAFTRWPGNPTGAHGPGRLPRLGLALEGRASRSSTCPAARCSRTTSWRRCSTCCTRRPAWRR